MTYASVDAKARCSPLGATLLADGANFAVFSQHATRVVVCLFDAGGEREVFRLALRREGDVHVGFVKGVAAGTRYGLRAEGPWSPEEGHRFDASKLLLDPYAREIDGPFRYHSQVTQRGIDSAGLVPKAVVRKPDIAIGFRHVNAPRFIYELNVRSFTALQEGVPVAKRGTVAALAEPVVIKHLVELGVDAVELMPITAWIDERHLVPLGLRNAWGYNPVSFFAVDPRLAPGGLDEVRDTVAALQAAGISVILDLVFNHTGESDAQGPVLSFRGIDNAAYYRLHDGRYVNDAGCGNVLALDRPCTVQLVVDALCHWVETCGIDGFRFDLATVMGRGDAGFSRNAPLLDAIASHPMLSTRLMIAEPWDVGPGGYQLGHFHPQWPEWNDKFRDDVRRFWRGDDWSSNALATRLTGSSDVMAGKAGPSRSINFIAAHDGFTLRDVVTYAQKNNHANGENNRDGKNEEVTWVNGDVRALLATLFLSRGTPMLTAGDEFGRTQLGNNNAYAQDNAVTWLDWARADRELMAYVAQLLRLRSQHRLLTDDTFLSGEGDATWFDMHGHALNWQDARLRFLGLALRDNASAVAIVVNGSSHDQSLRYPVRHGHVWVRRFCSKPLPGCPAISVSLFEEVAS